MNPRIPPFALAWFVASVGSPVLAWQSPTTDYWEALPVHPKPLQTFEVGFREARVDVGERVNREVTLQLSHDLASAYLGVGLPPGLVDRLAASTTWLGSDRIRIEITDLQHPAHIDPPGGQVLFFLRFSGLLATTRPESIAFLSVQNHDLLGRPVTTIPYSTGTSIDVADLRVVPSSLAQPVANHFYLEELRAPHALNPVTWSVTRGSLPSGLSLDSRGSFHGAPSTPGERVSFTVTAREEGGPVAHESFMLEVSNSAPKLAFALLYDLDASLTANAGDQILLGFDEPVQFGRNWLDAFAPTWPGDSLGKATLSVGASPRKLVLTLGTGALLVQPGGVSAIALTGAPAITDAHGQPCEAMVVPLIQPAADLGPLSELVLGTPLTPIVLAGPPFPSRTLVGIGLPSGLTIESDVSGAALLTGTPLAPGSGLLVIQDVTVPAAPKLHATTVWTVRPQPVPARF